MALDKAGQGTYVLILHLSSARSIRVGRLGFFKLEAGFYSYVGSAFGPGGIRARLRHHLRSSPRPYWHIDYLKRVARPTEAWAASGVMPREHDWAGILNAVDGLESVCPRFGASDCHCQTHLFYSLQRPVLSPFRRLLRASFPSDPSVRLLPVPV